MYDRRHGKNIEALADKLRVFVESVKPEAKGTDPLRGSLAALWQLKPGANNVCPPYDIVNDETYETLCKKSEYNFIRLERVEGEDGYARSAALLKRLTGSGVMKKDEKPGYYIYEEEFVYEGKTYIFDGLVCLCRTYDYADNVVKPHEETLSKAKKDRFELMKATFCNFSSVYSLFEDQNGYIQRIIDAY